MHDAFIGLFDFSDIYLDDMLVIKRVESESLLYIRAVF